MTQPTTIDTTTLLVSVTMGLPRQTTKLKQVAAKAEKEAGAARGTAKASMDYWRWEEGGVKHDGLELLREFQGRYKRSITHYARYPYVAGVLMLPAALAAPCIKEKEKFEEEGSLIRETWACKHYPTLAKNAPTRMGTFYSGADFPSLDECMKDIYWAVDIVPLAAADQVQRIALLAPDIAATIEDSTNKAYAKGKEEALAKLWEDVMAPIQHAVTTLEKDGAKIFDTLVGNIISIVDLVPAYNGVLNDPKLNELAEQAKAAFGGIKPDDLRASNEAKAKMLESAKSIVNSFKPYQRKLAV